MLNTVGRNCLYRDHNGGVLPMGMIAGGDELEVERLRVDVLNSVVKVKLVPTSLACCVAS